MENLTPSRDPDVLSESAGKLFTLNPSAYTRPTPTGAGFAPAGELVRTLRPEQLLKVPVRRPDDARAMLAGLWPGTTSSPPRAGAPHSARRPRKR